MPLYEATVPARYTQRLLAYVQSTSGSRLDGLLEAIGLDESMLDDVNASLTIAEFDAVLKDLIRRGVGPELGVELGRRDSLDWHGALGRSLGRCASLDQVLRMVSRYFRLITPIYVLHYRRTSEYGELIYRPAAHLSPAALRLFNEVHAVSFHAQYKVLLRGEQFIYDIYPGIEAPSYVHRYDDLRPSRFHFGLSALPEVRILIPVGLLDLRLPENFAPPLAREPEDLNAIQAKVGRSDRWVDWVVLMLREAEGCQPSLMDLSALLNISSRSLSLYLAREGQSFRELSKQVRAQRACALLKDGRHSISQIAYSLGYSDVANFSSAFSRSLGQSPRDWRKSYQALVDPSS